MCVFWDGLVNHSSRNIYDDTIFTKNDDEKSTMIRFFSAQTCCFQQVLQRQVSSQFCHGLSTPHLFSDVFTSLGDTTTKHPEAVYVFLFRRNRNLLTFQSCGFLNCEKRWSCGYWCEWISAEIQDWFFQKKLREQALFWRRCASQSHNQKYGRYLDIFFG